MVHRVEARIWAAVFLASAGCRPAAEPSNELPPDPAPASPSAASTPMVAGEAPTPPASASAGAPVTVSPADARAVCEAYKAKSDIRDEPVKAVPGATPHWNPTDTATWAANTDTIHCAIVRERTRTMIERDESQPCCRNGGGGRHQRPCPPAVTRKVPAERIVVEAAEVRRDGSLVKRAISARTSDPNPYQRHNCGRRPEGFAADRAIESELGAELAAMATLEAASVPAFARLARELDHHGAPPSLVRRTERARRDEIRHARQMSKLALAHGHAPSSFRAAPPTIRDPLAVARENAAEGCVVEAFGAVLATFQAGRAADRFRSTFEAIARDERRHAALAEDVDAWITSRLSESERAEVRAARQQAIAALRGRLAESSGVMASFPALGTPTPDEARALFEAYVAGFDAA